MSRTLPGKRRLRKLRRRLRELERRDADAGALEKLNDAHRGVVAVVCHRMAPKTTEAAMFALTPCSAKCQGVHSICWHTADGPHVIAVGINREFTTKGKRP
ncbi:hypothetical protein [Mycobacterium persicum]|uniref:hypothetical protein n=1 Tax=Mycobacterium persicum TaxID=1487726 RepID=UPI000A0D2B81|nr:hypothetical protein [Mycobacterium persicum]ORC02205.1 hypothetical protein B1T48_13985 [Mycobacterium persicum]